MNQQPKQIVLLSTTRAFAIISVLMALASIAFFLKLIYQSVI